MYDDNFLKDTLEKAFEDPKFYNVPMGIRRHDYSNMHGWWVRVSRDRTMFRKLFSDGVHGSIEESLRKAILYRHDVLSSFPVTIKKTSGRNLPADPEKRIIRKTEKGKLRPYIYWQARWYDKDHVVRFQPFPVHTLGEEEARAQALEAARKNHNRKPKLSIVVDPYTQQQFEPIERADVAVWASINDRRPPSKASIKEIANNDPFAFEGERKLEIHKSIERNRKLRNHKVSMFLEENEKLFCELCHFNFLDTYPFLSTDIIEVHHIIPLATLSKGTEINISDLMLLCSNCHFAVHQGDAEENLLMAMDHFEGANEKQINN